MCKYAVNTALWAKMLEKYGDDGSGHTPVEWRVQAVEEYKKQGGQLKKPAGQAARGKTLKAPK
jgi:hypothetical protein